MCGRGVAKRVQPDISGAAWSTGGWMGLASLVKGARARGQQLESLFACRDALT